MRLNIPPVTSIDNAPVMFSEFPDIVSPDELMVMLDIGRNSAYKLLQDNEIKSFRIGKRWKIPKKEIIEYISLE